MRQQDNEKKRQRDESQNLNLPSIHSCCYFCCSEFNHFSHFSHALSCKGLTLHWRGQLSQSILKRKLFPTIPRGGPKARVFSYFEEKGRSKTLHNDFWADAEFGWSSLLQFCFATIPMGRMNSSKTILLNRMIFSTLPYLNKLFSKQILYQFKIIRNLALI